MRKISILGCGWLGLPLAKHLIKNGYLVKGSRTSDEGCAELQQAGIIPFKILLNPKLEGTYLTDFFNSNILIITLPPKRRDDIEKFHVLQLQSVIAALKRSPVTHVLFISSTSVYPETNTLVTETTQQPPTKAAGKALLQVEKLLQSEAHFKTSIIRFGGLIGYDRMPGRFLAGKKNVENADAPVNVIHRDDCIELIYQLLEQNIWGEVFNAVADEHPTRKAYYTKAALQIGLSPPAFTNNTATIFKLVSAEKIKQQLHYTFIYPNPMDLLN